MPPLPPLPLVLPLPPEGGVPPLPPEGGVPPLPPEGGVLPPVPPDCQLAMAAESVVMFSPNVTAFHSVGIVVPEAPPLSAHVVCVSGLRP